MSCWWSLLALRVHTTPANEYQQSNRQPCLWLPWNRHHHPSSNASSSFYCTFKPPPHHHHQQLLRVARGHCRRSQICQSERTDGALCTRGPFACAEGADRPGVAADWPLLLSNLSSDCSCSELPPRVGSVVVVVVRTTTAELHSRRDRRPHGDWHARAQSDSGGRHWQSLHGTGIVKNNII